MKNSAKSVNAEKPTPS